MRVHRVYGRRSAIIIGAMMIAAFVPYVCRGSMLDSHSVTDGTSHHGSVSQTTGAPGASVIANEHGAARCAAYNSCCSTPAKQKSRYSPEALAPCVQIDIMPVLATAASFEVLHTAAEGLPVFPPGVSAPLIC